MRYWINLCENTETPSEIVQRVRDEFMRDNDLSSPDQINHGYCFEFADALEEDSPEIFQSIEIGNIFRYGGQYNDEPEGYDEELIAKHWPNITPYKGLSWEQMFDDVGLSWPGTHGWAHCRTNGLSYDAEDLEGKTNPFDLAFFKPYYDEFKKRLSNKS